MLSDSRSTQPSILVAGIGNRLIADDGFGPRVIDLLNERELPNTVEARDFGTAGMTIATDLADYDAVIFIDSMDHEGKPGTLRRSRLEIQKGDTDVTELARLTLHEAGLEGLLRFSHAIGTLPEEIYLVECKPKTIEPSLDLSPEVEAALEKAITNIEEILENIQGKTENRN